MRRKAFRLPVSAGLTAAFALAWSSVGALADKEPDPFDGSSIQPSTISFGGADPLPTSRTVTHWIGETRNPDDGITYRYNMVGVDPASDGSATIGVDIIPLDVTVDGVSFNGSEKTDGVAASPLFNRTTNFTTTSRFTLPNGVGSPTGTFPLSSGNISQLLDATMRSQFNKVSSESDYHLYLGSPVVFDPVQIDVPQKFGRLGVSPHGLPAAEIDVDWFRTRVQNAMNRLHLDPTRLAIFLTKDVLLYVNNDPRQCCVLGAHGAGHATGGDGGAVQGNGNQPVQTFVWSSWLTAGLLAPANPRTPDPLWVNKDISVLTHEITEWANDPFNTNKVQPWTVGNQYGCSDELETGDPTFGLGFVAAAGLNIFDPATLPDGTYNWWRDGGAYHIQDEVFLSWFMHVVPSTSQLAQARPMQPPPTGRYSLMGALNPAFAHPPATCDP